MTFTDFQCQCERALLNFLDRHGGRVAERNVRGSSEAYVHLVLEPVEAEVWIYDDEVELGVRHRRLHYEAAAFGDPNERVRAFLDDLKRHWKS